MMELVCPEGTPAALRAAVEAGAHAVYCGFADETNARNFPGLNFSREEMAEGVGFAHRQGARVLVAINTFPRAGHQGLWHRAVADAARAGADAVILADVGLLAHAAEAHPGLRLHLSVQAAANPDAINLYAQAFGVRRVVLPRVLTVTEIAAINREIDVETEVFVFGGLCVMAEGRCSLSSWATGLSPNMNGVCSPASHVSYADTGTAQEARLGGYLIHRTPKGAPVPYPTLCKGCFTSGDQTGHIFEDPVSLDATQLIPALQKAGVRALKIEGRQRSWAYVAQVVRAFRAAVEVWGHGRAPLAISGRCYHARLHDRAKDSCQFVCGEDPDGRDVDTLDGQPFLTVNGVQTLGRAVTTAAAQWQALQTAGVAALRLSPHVGDFAGVAAAWADALAGGPGLVARLQGLMPGTKFCDGFLAARPGAAACRP